MLYLKIKWNIFFLFKLQFGFSYFRFPYKKFLVYRLCFFSISWVRYILWRRKGLQPLNNIVEPRRIYRRIVGLQCPHAKLEWTFKGIKGASVYLVIFFLTKLVSSGGIFLFSSKKLKSTVTNSFAN